MDPRPRLAFDFAEPPDIRLPQSCHHLATLVRLEDLTREAKENRIDRMRAVKVGEGIIEEAMRDYYLKLKQAPVLREFNSIESSFVGELDMAMNQLEREFSSESQKKIRKWGEKLVKKNLHSSRVHLRSILGNVSGSTQSVS